MNTMTPVYQNCAKTPDMNADRGAYRAVNQRLMHYACVLWGAGIWYNVLKIRALGGKESERDSGGET